MTSPDLNKTSAAMVLTSFPVIFYTKHKNGQDIFVMLEHPMNSLDKHQ